MTREERCKIENKYCKEYDLNCGRCPCCADCEFNCVRTNKPCSDLTTDEIFDIWESRTCKKEDKTMTKKEEIQQEIEKTQKQLAALQEKLKEAEDEVPETLEIAVNDEYCYIDDEGDMQWTSYSKYASSDIGRINNHRAFLEERLAEIFADKTQFIADLLHFKYLYDRDYEPDWNNYNERKWFVYYDHGNHKYYQEERRSLCDPTNICFSTEKIAKKCADWLNKRNKE